MRSLFFFLYSALTFGASYPVLTYSTYLRDHFTPNAIATDSSGNIYIAGNATLDPSTSQNTVLLVKLNPQATQYLYVRYLGGSVNDYAAALAVDAAGNAYVAGSTASPDFPVTGGGNLGTAPGGQNSQRSFVAKFDPNGELVFSDLLGASTVSSAQAVAVNAAGQIVVSGMVSAASTTSFPTTAGAYSIANSANHPYLLELDPTGTKLIFSATGIGGSALAFDSSGNIYVAGTSYLLDYPTTGGAYQTTFAAVDDCFGVMCFATQGANQYVTKVDPTGSTLIYSSAVSGSGNTTNAGLAVDTAGNVYLTGYAGATYPYTNHPIPAPVTGVPFTIPALPFLSKLNASGSTLLFSIPLGGAGVQVDSGGNVYVGGGVGFPGGHYLVSGAFPGIGAPAPCLPFSLIQNVAYVAQVDGSGNILGSQFIGGGTLLPSAVALLGSTLWIAGATSDFNVPFTTNALTLPNLEVAPLPGAYLGAVDFSRSQPPVETPQIGCTVDSASFAAVGPVAPYQLVTILGTGLGPATGVSAPNDSTYTLAGVTVSLGPYNAALLYVSSTQINFAVPQMNSGLAPLEVTVNSTGTPTRALPITYANPSVFSVALNADGSVNSATNPAALGSTVSVFVNGLSNGQAPQLYSDYGWSVLGTAALNPFVLEVNLRVPAQLVNDFSCASGGLCTVSFALFEIFPGTIGLQSSATAGEGLGGTVYVNRGQ